MAGYSDDMLALRTSYEGKLHDLRAANSELAARATTAEAALAASQERERGMWEALEEAKQDIRRVRDGIAFVGRNNNALEATRKIDAALAKEATDGR